MRQAAEIAACIGLSVALLAACMERPITADREVRGDRQTVAARSRAPDGGNKPVETNVARCSGKRIYTRYDDGCRVQVEVGQTVELLVRDPHSPDPLVEGDAIELVETVNVGASGRRAWELRARQPGMSRIIVSGREPFELMVEVSPR